MMVYPRTLHVQELSIRHFRWLLTCSNYTTFGVVPKGFFGRQMMARGGVNGPFIFRPEFSLLWLASSDLKFLSDKSRVLAIISDT